MAQIFNDNFETGDFSLWTLNDDVTVETGIPGMSGTYCAELANDDSSLSKTLSASKPEVFVALDLNGINATGAYGGIIVFRNAAGAVLGMLYAAGPGTTPIHFKLEAWKGYFGTRVGLHNVNLNAGTKYHIEVRYIPHATTGIFQVKLDDVLVIDFAGSTAAATADVAKTQLGEVDWDSFYFHADNVIFDDAAWPNSGGFEPPPVDEFAAYGLAFQLSAPRVDQFAGEGLWMQFGGPPVNQFRGSGGFQISAPRVDQFRAGGYLALRGTSEFKFAFETAFAAGAPPGELTCPQ